MALSSSSLPVGVVGCGRMGRLHARSYARMEGVVLAGLYDTNPSASAALAAEYHTHAARTPEELLSMVRAVSIAVPTRAHLAVTEPFLRRGVACLIEKPLASDVAEGQRIVELARQSGAIVQAGHIERFNPAVQAMQHLGIEPRFIDVTRVSPLTFRSIDVGVVLDMMIHDIDIVLKLAGSPVKSIDAVGVSVIGAVEDICNARLTFASGCVANLTASRLALKTERKLRVFSRDTYVSLDYQKRHGVVVRRSENLDAILDSVERLRSGDVADVSLLKFNDLVKLEELPIDDVDPIQAEVSAFVESVRTGTPPQVSAEEGLAAVDVAHRIVASIKPGMSL